MKRKEDQRLKSVLGKLAEWLEIQQIWAIQTKSPATKFLIIFNRFFNSALKNSPNNNSSHYKNLTNIFTSGRSQTVFSRE